MNKFLFGILAMLIFGILPMGVYAQDDDPDDVSNAPDYDNPSLLWKITGDNIQTCYLFGTIHLIGEEDFSYPKRFMKKLRVSIKSILSWIWMTQISKQKCSKMPS